MIEEVKKSLKERLSDYRYNHCLRVADVAKDLAKFYKEDEGQAYFAGLVHDMAKEFTKEENLEFVKSHNLPEEVLNKENSKFLHGTIGAIIAKETYHFTDDMFNAVYYHTAGRPGMSKLEKIVYLADKIEPGKNYEGIESERKLAYQDLDQAVILCLKTKIVKLTKEGKSIHPNTIDTLNYLEAKVGNTATK